MKIGIIGHQSKINKHWNKAFGKGLLAHGISPFNVHNEKQFHQEQQVDLTVGWGKPKWPISSPRFLVMENGFWSNRLDWQQDYNPDNPSEISLGFDGLNGEANFYNKNSPNDRWERHEHRLRKWNTTTKEFVVVMGQVPLDAAVKNKIDINTWVLQAFDELKAIGVNNIVYRPHPKGAERLELPEGVITMKEPSLTRLLSRAALVVTFNSNSGVDAMLRGVPTFAYDRGSMVWNVATNDFIGLCVNNAEGEPPNREQWAIDLTYAQWNYREIESGLAWEHLKQGMGK